LVPSATASSFEISRVVVSVPLPAANGSTSVMFLPGAGHVPCDAVCADDGPAARRPAATAIAAANDEVADFRKFMDGVSARRFYAPVVGSRR
jgi:hypothetical protein